MDNKIFKCLIACVLIIGVWSIEEQSIEELRCLKKPPIPTKNLNLKWLISVPTWYYYFASKLDLYRTAADLARVSISNLKEEEVNSNACMSFKWAKTSTLYGFGDKKAEYELKREDDGIYLFTSEFLKLDGKTYLTLTDNKSFVFFYTCWEDDEASWGVLTATKEIDESTIKQITKHAKSLGFDEKYFINLKYDKCDNMEKLKDEL